MVVCGDGAREWENDDVFRSVMFVRRVKLVRVVVDRNEEKCVGLYAA